MALRFAIKINRNIFQNLGKASYSGNFASGRKHSDVALKHCVKEDGSLQNKAFVGRLSPILPSQNSPQQCTIDRNLQTSLAADYANAPLRADADINQSDALQKYRKFEKSSTYKIVKLPLKQPKLANPFPEPVKSMQSDMTSDLEKADQKVADTRCTKSSSRGGPSNLGNFAVQSRRYSTVMPDPGKCGPKTKRKKKCPSIKGCLTPAKAKNCDRDYPYKECKKQSAPYPAYSEFCHSVPDEKPSECKLCPWKPADHPTFKPPKKRFHSSASGHIKHSSGSTNIENEVHEQTRASNEVEDAMRLDKCNNCKRYKTGRGPPSKAERSENIAKKPKSKPDEKKKKGGKKSAAAIVELEEVHQLESSSATGYSMDAKKPPKCPKVNKSTCNPEALYAGSNLEPSEQPELIYYADNKPCPRPTSSICGKDQKKNDKKGGKKSGKKGGKGGGKKKKASHGSNATVELNANTSWITLIDSASVQKLSSIDSAILYLVMKSDKGKCQNVPPGACNPIKKKPYKRRPDGCPKPKGPKRVKDCPKDKCKKTCKGKEETTETDLIDRLVGGKRFKQRKIGYKNRKRNMPSTTREV